MQNNTMVLQDGRKLGFATYGDKNGQPVFLLHGTPGSRIWFLEDDPIAYELGFYFIATDRPGFGLSDPHPNRSLIDYAADLAQLADFLEIDTFSVLGVSGGGAFATAIAHKLPKRVNTCVLVSTATPFINGKPPKDMAKENRLAFLFTKYAPFILKFSSNVQKKMLETNPEKYKAMLKKGGKHLPEWDNAMLRRDDVLEATVIQNLETYRQGVDETHHESKLLTKDWGFAFESIHVPVHIWHGEADSLSPISEVKKIAKRFPNCTTHYIKNGGHFLTESDDVWTSILTTIKSS